MLFYQANQRSCRLSGSDRIFCYGYIRHNVIVMANS
ncbi:hypothetical protein sync_1612 [Synechococcus sp. CC9311]|nr:hypothetical protein sync_1612 [Synechococcus sp. CC9311]